MFIFSIFLSSFLYFFPIITFLPYRLSIKQYLTLYFLLFFSLILIATTSNAAVIFLLIVVSIYLCKITKKNLPTVCSVIVAYFLLVLIDQIISIVLTELDYGVASTHTDYSCRSYCGIGYLFPVLTFPAAFFEEKISICFRIE